MSTGCSSVEATRHASRVFEKYSGLRFSNTFEESSYWRGVAYSVLGQSLHWRGKTMDAVAALEDAVPLARTGGSPHGGVLARPPRRRPRRTRGSVLGRRAGRPGGQLGRGRRRRRALGRWDAADRPRAGACAERREARRLAQSCPEPGILTGILDEAERRRPVRVEEHRQDPKPLSLPQADVTSRAQAVDRARELHLW